MPDIARVRTVFTGVIGTPWYSNLFFAGPSFTASTLTGLVSSFWTDLGSAMTNQVDWEVQTDIAIISDATGAITSVIAGAGASGSGATAGDPLPFMTQGLVNWRTGSFVAGREVRGKCYVPAPVETFNESDGTPVATYLDDLAAAANDLRTDANTAGNNLVVFSPTHNVSRAVSAISVKSAWAVMRSRRD